MNSQIFIRNLKLRTFIGIEDWEIEHQQDVCINVTMKADLEKASQSDQIDDTVNYKTICKAIIQLVENNRFFLIEKMAGDICTLILKNKQVSSVTVCIDKPGALRFTDSVAVEIEAFQP